MTRTCVRNLEMKGRNKYCSCQFNPFPWIVPQFQIRKWESAPQHLDSSCISPYKALISLSSYLYYQENSEYRQSLISQVL